jgi:hypothetical protein
MSRLGSVDALELAFATQIGFKLGEHPEHVEEGLAFSFFANQLIAGKPFR